VVVFWCFRVFSTSSLGVNLWVFEKIFCGRAQKAPHAKNTTPPPMASEQVGMISED